MERFSQKSEAVIEIAKQSKAITCRLFVNGQPIESMTADEREAFANRCAERMGETLNGYINQHVGEYQKLYQSL